MNLRAADGYTTMYSVKNGACYQYEIQDLYVNKALTNGSVAGTCSTNAHYTQKGKTFTYHGDDNGFKYALPVTEYTQGAGLQELCSGWSCNQSGFGPHLQ